MSPAPRGRLRRGRPPPGPRGPAYEPEEVLGVVIRRLNPESKFDTEIPEDSTCLPGTGIPPKDTGRAGSTPEKRHRGSR